MWAASPERGISLTTLFVVFLPVLLMCAGLVVDGTARAQASRQVAVAASRAARVGTDTAAAERLAGRTGAEEAQRAAERSLSLSGVEGSARVENGRLVVEARRSVETVFLGIIGVNHLHAAARVSADLVRA